MLVAAAVLSACLGPFLTLVPAEHFPASLLDFYARDGSDIGPNWAYWNLFLGAEMFILPVVLQRRLPGWHLIPYVLSVLFQANEVLKLAKLPPIERQFEEFLPLALIAFPLVSWLLHSLIYQVPSIPHLKGSFAVAFIESTLRPSRSFGLDKKLRDIDVRFYYPVDAMHAKTATYPKLLDDTYLRDLSQLVGLPRVLFTALKSLPSRSLKPIGVKKSITKTLSISPYRSGKDSAHIVPVSGYIPSLPVCLVSSTGVSHLNMLAEELASQGYVVVSVTHQSSAANGKLEDSEERFGVETKEISFVLDHLMAVQYGQSLNPYEREDADESLESSLFKARLDLQRIAIVGYGESASVAVTSLTYDRRLKAAICLDALAQSLPRDIQKQGAPNAALFVQSGTFSHENTDMLRQVVSNTRSGYLFHIRTVSTFALLDASYLLPGWLRLLGQKCQLNRGINVREAIEEYILQFLAKHVTRKEDVLYSPSFGSPSASSSRRQSAVLDSTAPSTAFPLLNGQSPYNGEIKLECVGW